MSKHALIAKEFPVLDRGFISLVDVMGDDDAIVQAARISYNNDQWQGMAYITHASKLLGREVEQIHAEPYTVTFTFTDKNQYIEAKAPTELGPTLSRIHAELEKAKKHDRGTIRYMMRHGHTSPFEMVEFKFMVQVPMDCWRQWIRHRTASVNEYSTRYTEAIDICQQTPPEKWRLQAVRNKQGSDGYLTEWPDGYDELTKASFQSPGGQLSAMEEIFHEQARKLYQERLTFGVAKEQARKDLPLSTYTRAIWKCDLHNIFGFLRQRMDSHAQLEIRSYANAMAEIVKQVVPVAWEAFEDYVLHARKFSRMEMEIIRNLVDNCPPDCKPDSFTDNEWSEFLGKLK